MKKELIAVISVAICLFIGFAMLVFVTESQNARNLRDEFTSERKTVEEGKVEVTPPTETAIGYQKNKAVVWVIRLALSFLIPFFFLLSGLSAGIRSWALGKSSRFILAIAL